MSNTKERLIRSALMLLVCISLFIGSTFAWFTDNVSSSNNVIVSGNLDVDMYWTDKLVGDDTEWYSVDSENGSVFSSDNWEPGYTEVKYLKVVNKGNLAFKYELSLLSLGEIGLLADVVDVYSTQLENGATVSPYDNRAKITGMMNYGVLKDAVSTSKTVSEGILLPKKANDNNYNCGETIIAIALQMKTDAGNKYQNQSIGDGFTIQALATQFDYEKDSFGSDYDKEAFFPKTYLPINITKGINGLVKNGVLTEEIVINAPYGISVTIPAGVKVNDDLSLTLSITEKQNSNANVKLEKNDELKAYDVHVEGIAKDNTVPMIINMGKVLPEGLNKGNLSLYHVEDNSTKVMQEVNTYAELNKHNQFTYEPSTGELTVSMATFSEVTVLADTTKAWEGEYDYSWYDASEKEFTIANADQLAAFSAIVGGMNGQTQDSFEGKTVKLTSDVNLGDKESENNPDIIFYPIGYYNSTGSYEKTNGGSVTSSVSSFEGTFDGNGHIISNFYQNTWEMFGDYNDGYSGTPNYYKDAMGLFGYVLNGTVKNLTVNNFSSDGEYTSTGVIAAYADGNSTFENIAITNCNPRVYNTGNGGIIGIAGDTSAANDDHITLKNITVDNSNKISALWGSWDVACGGLVGMYRGNVDGSGNATGDTISFENCHVSAQIDVYNDVCANYQYYAYRYSGMIIGSVRHNTTNSAGKTIPNMTGISATGCTVNYGDWNDYYYCEFEKNSLASYSKDYQFSRVPHSELEFTDSNGNGVVDADERESVTGCTHDHTAEENHQAIYLPFHQLFTGYSWGVSSIGLEKYSGIVTNLDITEGDQEGSVEKFKTKFNRGDFLYRVGNLNAVSVGDLFEAINEDSITGSGVVVSVEKENDNSNVSGTFTADTKYWTKGTIKFEGTGVVKITIQDYKFCTPTVLRVEVVDAVNATSATSATKNNVVLLNDVNLNTLEVSNGYTLYGNGFKMEAQNDVMYDALGVGFVTVKNGHLDNVQIICPNFSYSILYASQIKHLDNTAIPSDSSNDARGNVRSAVMVDGNSEITNSFIHGGRAAIYLRSGHLRVDNSTISGGATANIHVLSAQSLTLKDCTLIQKPLKANVHDTSKTIMGFSGLFECDENGEATPLYLEGSLIQNAWVNKNYQKYLPAGTEKIVEAALEQTNYLHDLNGDGENEALNLGFTYMPQNYSGTTKSNVIDSRTNKISIPYGEADVRGYAKVYSYKNTNGLNNEFNEDIDYVPNTQGSVTPVLTFKDANDSRVFETTFNNSNNRWESSLTVNLDDGNYNFSFNNLIALKHGEELSYKVLDNENKEIDVNKVISLTSSGQNTYKLIVTDLDDKEHVYYFVLTATKTSIPEPVVIDTTGGTPLLVVKNKNSDWSCAIPALEGIKIKYYTTNGEVTLDLATLTPASTGKQNGANNFWETSKDGYKLKITSGYIHEGKQVYGMPVVVNNGGNKMYFTISSTNGYVSTSTAARAVTLTYEFTDPNGKTLSFTKDWNFKYADYKNGTQYSYSEFVNGTLKEASSPSPCVTPDTLITLADGTKKEIQYVTYDDELLIWNFETGTYDVAKSSIVMNHGYDNYEIVTVKFDDGTEVNTINGHGFFDKDINEFVILSANNVEEYIGHNFVKQDGNTYTTVKLVDYDIKTKYTESWSVLTAEHYNCILEDMFTLTPAEVEGSPKYLMPYKINDNLQYNKLFKFIDILRYGLYKYEDFDEYMTEEQFEALGLANFKVSVGKGYITYEEILELINIHIK